MPLDPACSHRLPAPAIGQFGRPAPQFQRFVEARRRLTGLTCGHGLTTLPGGRRVADGVDLGFVQGPARPLCQHEPVTKRATQRRDVGLQRLGGGPRWVRPPEQLDECLPGDDGTAVQPEHRQDSSRFGARDRDRKTELPDLKRPQNPQLHRRKRTHACDRRRVDSPHGQGPVKIPPRPPSVQCDRVLEHFRDLGAHSAAC